MIHDPAIFYDEVSGNYYTYSTGAICQKSKDLVHWQEIGKVVERPPQESVEWTGSEDIWAPDIVKVGKEYRLYCSNSSWGVRQSCIFLAVADCPEGPFEPKGCVLKTTEKFPQSVTNAIDANIIEDAKTGEQYMLYGSFWGGCHVLKLNKTTGFAEEEGIGVCIARRPKWQSGSMEGPYMVYNAQNNYYYLFVSYGSLTREGGYQMRVFRSKTVDGEYVDMNGAYPGMWDDNAAYGLKLSGNYYLPGLNKAYMATGHNSAFVDEDGKKYIVYHTRFDNGQEYHEPRVHQYFLNQDGWPCMLPYATDGETIAESGYGISEVAGTYYVIDQGTSISARIAQPVKLVLMENGNVYGENLEGTWSMENGTCYMTLSYGGKEYNGVFCQMKDEAGTDVMTFSAVGANESVWGVKYFE